MQLLPPVLRLMLLPVLNVLGPIIIGFSLSMLIPLALSLWKKDGASAVLKRVLHYFFHRAADMASDAAL